MSLTHAYPTIGEIVRFWTCIARMKLILSNKMNKPTIRQMRVASVVRHNTEKEPLVRELQL